MKNNLLDIILNIKDKNELNSFLLDLLTQAEYEEVKKRWEIVKMLDCGLSHHEIAKKLHVGVATVTRGSKALKNSKGGFAYILKKPLK